MPHKKSILSENLTGLSRMVRSYVTPSLENIALWHRETFRILVLREI